MKKIICLILSMIILVGLIPANLTAFADENEILVFEDYFKRGNLFWHIVPDWTISDEKLTSPVHVGCNAYLNNEELINWHDYSMEFDFVINEYSKTANNWMGFFIREHMFYMNLNGISTLYNNVSKSFSNFIVKEGTPYTIRAVANGQYISLYIKQQGDKFFRDLGTLIDKSDDTGSVRFRSICTNTQISGVRVFIPENTDLCFKPNVGIMEVGERNIVFENKNNIDVTFTSSDEKIATVLDNGKLNVIKDGTFLLTAKDKDGNVIDTAMYAAALYVNSIDFMAGSRTLYVGDHYEITAYYVPTASKMIGTDWYCSDEEVIELVGSYTKRRCAVAKKPGVATVTAVLREGGSLRKEANITITVVERPEAEKTTAKFALNGVKHEINPMFFGVQHDRAALNDGTPFSQPHHFEGAEDIGFQSVRGPGGSETQRFNYITGKESSRTYNGEFQGFTLDDIYELPNHLDVPFIYCLNVVQEPFDDPQVIVDQITELKKHTTHPIIVELGNEVYSAGGEISARYPEVDDYGKACVEYYNAIKAAHPDVQVAVCSLGKDMEKRILADPNNSPFANPNDWEFTQAGRVWYWNETLGYQYNEGYDLVSNHPYTHQSDISYINQDEYIADHFTFNQEYYTNLLFTDREYGGKHQVLTEWGDIVETVHADPDAKEQARRQTMFDPGYGVVRIERLFQMLKTGVVDATSYHNLQHSSGFGIMSLWGGGENGNLVKLPTYFAFKAFGEVINKYNWYYDVDDYNVKSKEEIWPWCSTLTTYNVNVPESAAWGLGDETGVKMMAFCNHTNGEQTVSVDGLQLKKYWGFAPDEMFPEFLTKEGKTWAAVTPTQEEVYTGTQYDEDFATEITLPPYSIVFAEVSGTPVIPENIMAGRVSKLTENAVNHGLVLALNHNTAWWDTHKTVIDENSAVKPGVKNGRTLLPLRFVSETFGADVAYEEATERITINYKDTEIVFTVGDNKYYVNEEEKLLETPPEISDGRTLIPLRALTEALGKSVFWDDRGLIVITNSPYSFVEPYRDQSTATPHYTELLALFDGEN